MQDLDYLISFTKFHQNKRRLCLKNNGINPLSLRKKDIMTCLNGITKYGITTNKNLMESYKFFSYN